VIAVDADGGMVAAFFDLDGTLLAAPSLEWRFVGYLLKRDEIRGGHVTRWLARIAEDFWHDPRGATVGNKRYLCGIGERLLDEWERSDAPELFRGGALTIFDEALQRIVWHRAQDHRLFVVSGTLAPLARVVARCLATRAAADIEVCATELEVAVGAARIWNGRIAGEHMSGGAKLRAVRRFAVRYGIDLARSYAYGDSLGDLQMLEGVGNAVAVNPTRDLARVARKRGWRTCNWEKTLGGISSAGARQFASKAAR
jgi:HAD superfamily hydrolase (TIGR01490 family)